MPQPPYSSSFFEENERSGLRSARVIMPWLLQRVPVQSVVDVGCSSGTWLRICAENGIKRVFGMDNNWVPREQLRIPGESFLAVDLERPLPQVGYFDLALNLEVAEHLSAQRAEGHVADLCRLAPLVLFSAAIPGQGGTHHINEQWPAFWFEHFHHHGFRPLEVRHIFWDAADVDWWYRQNLTLYASEEAFARWPSLATLPVSSGEPPLALIHPECYRLYRWCGLRTWLRLAKPAMKSTWRRLLRQLP